MERLPKQGGGNQRRTMQLRLGPGIQIARADKAVACGGSITPCKRTYRYRLFLELPVHAAIAHLYPSGLRVTITNNVTGGNIDTTGTEL